MGLCSCSAVLGGGPCPHPVVWSSSSLELWMWSGFPSPSGGLRTLLCVAGSQGCCAHRLREAKAAQMRAEEQLKAVHTDMGTEVDADALYKVWPRALLHNHPSLCHQPQRPLCSRSWTRPARSWKRP